MSAGGIILDEGFLRSSALCIAIAELRTEVTKVDLGSDPSGNYNNTLIIPPIIYYR